MKPGAGDDEPADVGVEGEGHEGGEDAHAGSGGDEQRLTSCLVDEGHAHDGEDQFDETDEGGAQEFDVRNVVAQSGLEHSRAVVGDGVLATDLVEGGEQQADEERGEQRLLEQVAQLAVLVALDGSLDVGDLTMGLFGAADDTGGDQGPRAEGEGGPQCCEEEAGAPMRRTLRRPILSARKPEKPTPTTPPIMMEEITSPCSPADRWYAWRRNSMAPEMLTVS